MKQCELYKIRKDYLLKHHQYKMVHYNDFDYEVLNNIMWITRAGKAKGKRKTYNNCIIMCDTETSRKKLKNSPQIKKLPSGHKARENHVVAWTISIRAFDMNIVTLYGHKPTTFCSTLHKIHNQMMGDVTITYFHNYSYDYSFLRRFLVKEFGMPDKSLNIKAHYPLFMKFDCGLEIRDSLILAQKSLEKWADDLNVEHKKAIGKWNYTKFRNQDCNFTLNELEYIEHDTLAGVECINTLMKILNKRVYSMPYTSTGIIREEIILIGMANAAHDLFLRCAPTYEQYIKLTKLFHGGFTHANRFMIGEFIHDVLVQCYDFVSSYPFCMLTQKYPMEAFHKMNDCKLSDILKDSENTAYMFKLIMYNVRLKELDHVMPALQYSKCVECVNPSLDNGRVLEAAYVEIYLNEVDASVIAEQYISDSHICVEVEYAQKDYLPRWFTDYIFNLFYGKCELSLTDDEVNYKIQKGKINGCYGMTVQRSIQDEIIEVFDSFEYKTNVPEDKKQREKAERKEYDKYLKKKRNVFLYQWGVWVTSYAFRNIHELNKCVKPESEGGLLLYNDTDSGYAINWDIEKINAYNDKCLQQLRANNYDAVVIDDHTFILGTAEHKPLKDDYTEFMVQGAKRYAGRCKKDNKIHITVAGVPKKGADCLNDDLHNFRKDFIFKGTQTGKKTHVYFVSDIYIDADGNETGDSIDLLPCDYKLDPTEKFEIDDLFSEDQEVQIYEEW